MTVGERLKKMRLAKGMTQEDLGKILGVTKGAIQKYESGQIINLKVDSIRKLSDLFQIAPGYFIFDDIPDYGVMENVKDVLSIHFGQWFITFLKNFHDLNDEGKEKVYRYCLDMAMIEQYKREESN